MSSDGGDAIAGCRTHCAHTNGDRDSWAAALRNPTWKNAIAARSRMQWPTLQLEDRSWLGKEFGSATADAA